jgi:DNA-binding response OmpR family regulator
VRKQLVARILIIDDDEQVLTMLQQLLEREGYEVITAPDGKAGMRLFREEGADLIITDILMPEKDGLETIIELRKDYPDVRIMAISGGGEIEPRFYLHFANEFGALSILTKPFEREELLAAVRELLN